MSRLLAGASIGLMASNVYIADVASTKNIVFFNYTRQIFITLGAIMMYAIAQIIYKVMFHKMKQFSCSKPNSCIPRCLTSSSTTFPSLSLVFP